MRRLRLLLALLLMLLGPYAARADQAKDARALFKEANAHFAVGEFTDAAEKYMAAYKLKQDPALLYNAAQSFRLAGNNERALVLYKNYLQFFPRAPNVEEVRGQILKLTDAIAAAEKAKNAPPTSTVEQVQPGQRETAPPPATTVPPPQEQPPPAATAATTNAPAERQPVYKKWWLWTIVGVVVAGAVVGGVLAATLPSGSWQTTADVGPGARSALGVSF